MTRYLFHPLGKDNYKREISTYSGHGVGKLDIMGNKMPLYAMTDSVIVNKAMYPEEQAGTGKISALVLQPAADIIISPQIYIRYLHGTYDKVKVGDKVSKGQLIGYSSNVGTYTPHLHIDMSWVSNDFSPVYGTLNSDKTTYTVKSKKYDIDPEIVDWDKVNKWKNQNGGNSSNYGYLWLIMASKGQLLTSTSNAADVTDAAQLIIMSLYLDAIQKYGTTTGYYGSSNTTTLKLNGSTVKGRRDCSGYINMIVQYLGDEGVSYQASTSSLISNPPKNWKVYKTSSVTPQAGDIVVASSHAEILTGKSNGVYYSYGLGGDYELEACGKAGKPIELYNGIGFYDHLLRREK